MSFLRFPELERRGLVHSFTLRTDPPLASTDLTQILETGRFGENYVIGEQTHGKGVAVVGKSEAGRVIPQVDALVTREKNLTLDHRLPIERKAEA